MTPNKINNIYIYALLTKRDDKMAGHWPSSFSAFLWTETNFNFVMLTDYVSRLQAIFFSGTKAGNTERAK